MGEELQVKIIREIIESIVTEGSKIDIDFSEATSINVITIVVPKEEAGKVIGKKGATVEAIRLILSRIRNDERKKWHLEINV